MKYKVFLLSCLLTGCYLANGPSPSSTYWMKNGKKITYAERKQCYQVSKKKALNEIELKRFDFLENKFDSDPIDMINNHKQEYEEYEKFLEKIREKNLKCFYDLGYRFKAPISWCLAHIGDNIDICMENMKYRN